MGALQYIERARKMTLLNFLTFLKNNFSNFDKITILKKEDNKIKFRYSIIYYLNEIDFYLLKDYLNYMINDFVVTGKSAVLTIKEERE